MPFGSGDPVGDSITTQLDDTVRVSAATRAKAIANMRRLGAADLLEILGLAEPAPVAPKPVEHCPKGHVLPSHGVCRRSEDCRIAARAAGHEA